MIKNIPIPSLRHKAKILFGTAALILMPLVHAAEQTETIGSAEKFSFSVLKDQAHDLAQQPYKAHAGEIPNALKKLDWDQYQQIGFKHDEALWKNQDSLFRAELFHLGLNFTTPVTIYELADGKARQVAYSPDLFNYGDSGVKAKKLPKDLGFAGFRFHFFTDWSRDLISFLGASYFRAVDSTMQYGLSARGLAVDTAFNRPEEFPMFTKFWLQRPRKGEETAIVYALLDSPSVTGAYRFAISPGPDMVINVDTALYPRKDIERLGIAPLTSMYMVGENSRRADYDWRPEIHDSDGLAMLTQGGDWIWRPLANPRMLRFNVYNLDHARGFGLFQRDQNFDHYQDDGIFYDKRPSVWIEPTNDWGKGAVDLVEIPAQDETFDNIVAFWNPAQPIKAGQELQYSYKMLWTSRPPAPRKLAHVVDSFTGLGGVIGQKRHYYSKRFVIDFKGGTLPMLGNDTQVKPVIETSAGRVEITSARPLHAINGYRAMFDVVPPDGTDHPINLRVYLEADGQPISEYWMYQWNPPKAADRQLHNAGHLQ